MSCYGAQAQALEEVTYLLPAPANLTAFAPWMLALHKGYYKEEGLDVKFVSGRGGVDVAKQVGAGNAPIGGAIGDTPIIVRANGIPVKAVAVLGAGSLTLIATKEDGDLKHVKELKGKTATVMAYTDTTYYAFLGSLEKAGLTKQDLDIQAAGPAGIWQLFNSGRSDAMAGVPDWIVSAENAGAKIRILPQEETFQSMAQAILASEKVIKENPELVSKLVRATLRGMQDIMHDPESATTEYVKAVPAYQGQEASIRRTFDLYNQYVYAGQKVPGAIDRDRMEAVQNFYVEQAIVPRAQALDDLYTNTFVPAP
ncbi:ABC transporter substrate-binding protein [Lampropedia puyangensis]|uniref:ABC transporter substrate-binding protein n=2 Tax=Lampropedia puyangensis TaxID=1330072 RepID=A0A4S8EUS9_9BURK|nr:ABC transporter substrate-binding protein [Lampropedia puyangensis]THT96171.1 ABC transporter substrate-binding protein [Lampropedia puyangensis]